MKQRSRHWCHAAAALVLAVFAGAALAQDAGFADESKDFGVAATTYPKLNRYGEPTPTEIPGGKVVTTQDLAELLKADAKPVVVVAYGAQKTVPGAVIMDGAGEGRLLGADQDKFVHALETLTAGDKAKPVVFYCHGPKCWLSYNAALHAIALGYTHVLWYRGGRDAWKAAKMKFVDPSGTW